MFVRFMQMVVMQEAGAELGGGGSPPAEPPVADPEQAVEGDEPQGISFEQKYLKQRGITSNLHKQVLKSQTQIKELNARLEKLAGQDKLWDEDPVKALQARGIDYNDLTRRILQSNDLSPEDRERAQIKQELDELKSERQKEVEAREQAEAQAQEGKLLDDIQSFYESGNEDYAFSAALGVRSQFLKELRDHLAEYGENASDEEQVEIAARLEKQTRETVQTQVETLLKKSSSFRDSLKQMLAGIEEAPSDDDQPDQQAEQVETRVRPRRAAPKTITRAQQSATGARTPKRRETFEERKARILAGG